jgi:adenosylhomocysteine nucleosidase
LPQITILTAVAMEQRAIVRALRRSSNAMPPVRLIGIGGVRFDKSTAPSGVWIMAGLAGALDPSLRVGDVLLDDPHGVVPAELVRRLALKVGSVHTATKMVCTTAEKADLFRKTNALGVDMEQAIVRRTATAVGTSVVGVRAISDAANEALDARVIRLVDEVGRARPGRIGAAILRSPGLVPYLARLGKNSKIACERLGVAVRAIVDSLESRPVPGPEDRAGDGPALTRNER